MEERNKQYRIPLLSEFKQGFKFQMNIHFKGEHIGGICWMNCDKQYEPFYAQEDKWVDQEVWWDRKPSPDIKETQYGDITVYWKECKMDLMPNYSLETVLENGRIRAEK